MYVSILSLVLTFAMSFVAFAGDHKGHDHKKGHHKHEKKEEEVKGHDHKKGHHKQEKKEDEVKADKKEEEKKKETK